MEEKAFKIRQRNEIANIMIHGAVAAIETFANNGGYPYGLVAAGLMAATTLMMAGQVGSESFTPKPLLKAGTGGKLQGDSHQAASGGIPIMAEGNEWIINKASSEKYDGVLERINTLGNENSDVDSVGDLIDYFGEDIETRSI